MGAPGSLSQHRHLHSTMYLLNHRVHAVRRSHRKFTFHYVSIKSNKAYISAASWNKHLHSTMYLLNPRRLDLDPQH